MSTTLLAADELRRRRRRGEGRGRQPAAAHLVALPPPPAGGLERRGRGRCSIWSRSSPTSSPPPTRTITDAKRSYIPPQAIHWFDEGRFAPHVFGLKGVRDPRTFKLVYTPDPSAEALSRLFVRGYGYDSSGPVPDRPASARRHQRPPAGRAVSSRHRPAGPGRLVAAAAGEPHLADHRPGRRGTVAVPGRACSAASPASTAAGSTSSSSA